VKKRKFVDCEMDEAIKFGSGFEKLLNNLMITLARLPQEAYDFSSTNIRFCSAVPQTIPVKEVPQDYIIILRKIDTQTIIAHEIAHAFLHHPLVSKLKDDCERKADDLRIKWGFRGKIGCNCYPDNCARCFNFSCSKFCEQMK
jgi:hypothetical protein